MMPRRFTEICTQEIFLPSFKFPSTNKLIEPKEMTFHGDGTDCMMDLDYSFLEEYINPYGPVVELREGLPPCPSPPPMATQSEPCAPPALNTELQPIASPSEFSSMSVDSTPKRRAAPSIDHSGAKEASESKGKEKRGRASNWTKEEKEALILLKLEALETSEKCWFRFVSEQLGKRHDMDRAEKSCQQQWDLLKKAYKAIGNLHELKSRSGEQLVLFWDMDESARVDMKKMWNEELKHLPAVFPKEWYDLMGNIIRRKQVKETQDTKACHGGEKNWQASASAGIERANALAGPSDTDAFLPGNQELVASDVLCHDSIKQESEDKILPTEGLMSLITVLVDKQIGQALTLEFLRREEDSDQKYREKFHAIEGEHERRLQVKEAEHLKRLQAIEGEHTRWLQVREAEQSQRWLAKEAEHSQRLEAIEAAQSQRWLVKETEHSQRLQAIEAAQSRRWDEEHRQRLISMLDEEELVARLKLTTIEEKKRELA